MLALSRKWGQRIIIGEGDSQIVLMALKPGHSGTTRIGIEAPAEIPVHREEVYDKIQRDKR